MLLRKSSKHTIMRQSPVDVEYPSSGRPVALAKANPQQAEKAKRYLRSFLLVPRDILFPDSPTEAQNSQRTFIGILFIYGTRLYAWYSYLYNLDRGQQNQDRQLHHVPWESFFSSSRQGKWSWIRKVIIKNIITNNVITNNVITSNVITQTGPLCPSQSMSIFFRPRLIYDVRGKNKRSILLQSHRIH
ncbi:hypothetical protein H2248_000277 [Termitomyces sp. 'cryptogamus']|nr:hypothetical protein H2248_000277 [Termitomyces sp. 'cryptogamus']